MHLYTYMCVQRETCVYTMLTTSELVQVCCMNGINVMARLAQSAERKALNLVVVGSSPTVGAYWAAVPMVFSFKISNQTNWCYIHEVCTDSMCSGYPLVHETGPHQNFSNGKIVVSPAAGLIRYQQPGLLREQQPGLLRYQFWGWYTVSSVRSFDFIIAPPPGIEPGSSAWQAEILTTILQRMLMCIWSCSHDTVTQWLYSLRCSRRIF